MNKSETEGCGICPKRVWTLSVLSEENPLGDKTALPRGLMFHLSRCPSCRELADRLLAVNGGLAALASQQPEEALVDRANARALAAIEAGVGLQRSSLLSAGEAEWPDDLLVSTIDVRATWWRPIVAYAAAAVIIAALLVALPFAPRNARDPGLMVERHSGGTKSPLVEANQDDLPEESPDSPQVLVAEGGQPGQAAPARGSLALPGESSRDVGWGARAFQRAWVPGRDYDRAVGYLIDNGTPPASNGSFRDKP